MPPCLNSYRACFLSRRPSERFRSEASASCWPSSSDSGLQNRLDQCDSDTGLHLVWPATEQVNGRVCKTLHAWRNTMVGLHQSSPPKNSERFTALVRLRARCNSGRGLHQINYASVTQHKSNWLLTSKLWAEIPPDAPSGRSSAAEQFSHTEQVARAELYTAS